MIEISLQISIIQNAKNIQMQRNPKIQNIKFKVSKIF